MFQTCDLVIAKEYRVSTTSLVLVQITFALMLITNFTQFRVGIVQISITIVTSLRLPSHKYILDWDLCDTDSYYLKTSLFTSSSIFSNKFS